MTRVLGDITPLARLAIRHFLFRLAVRPITRIIVIGPIRRRFNA
jgi:hypothetical protein